MVANSLLEIYTLLFAWNLYGAIWDVLVGSGIALIPFVAAMVTNFLDNYENGDAETAVRGMEVKLVSMIFIMMMCVIPYKGWEIDLATVQYDLEVPDCNPPLNTEGTGDSTSTAYDDSFSGMGGLEVYKPVGWSFVSFISSAITHSTIRSMACVNNYEFMLLRISQVTIQDPELRERIRDFHEVCYQKAVERFDINPTPLPANISEVEDIDWMGSRVLLNTANEYYRHPESYMSNMSGYGFTRQVAIRDSDAAHESEAHPYCDEIWNGESGPGVVSASPGLRALILDDIPNDEAGDLLEDWMDWGSQVLTIGTMDDATKEDLMIKLIIQSEAANLQSQTDVDLSNDFDIDKAWYRTAFESVLTGVAWFASVDEFLQAHAMKQMVKIAGPMILALIQMVVIMAAPIIMVNGKYSLATFVGIAFSYFTFEFINAIWAATFWFDQHVLDIYLSQAGWLDVATNSFLISAVSAGSIILLPTVWISLMAWSGAGMVRGMGMGGVGGGRASGSGAFQRASGRAAGAVGKRISAGRNK